MIPVWQRLVLPGGLKALMVDTPAPKQYKGAARLLIYSEQ